MTKLTDNRIDKILLKYGVTQNGLPYAKKELYQLFPQPLDDKPFSTRCGDCPDLHFEVYYSCPHPERRVWKCGVLGVELINNDAHGVRKHYNCPKLHFPQPLDDKELEEEIEFMVCSSINGDLESCKREWCKNCSFKLPRLQFLPARILALLAKEYMSKEECEECQAQTECKIEEAKREERERIFREADTMCPHYGNEGTKWVKRCCDECWQAIGGE